MTHLLTIVSDSKETGYKCNQYIVMMKPINLRCHLLLNLLEKKFVELKVEISTQFEEDTLFATN
jgi:hypothetical protein